MRNFEFCGNDGNFEWCIAPESIMRVNDSAIVGGGRWRVIKQVNRESYTGFAGVLAAHSIGPYPECFAPLVLLSLLCFSVRPSFFEGTTLFESISRYSHGDILR
jgi:hypothetical protein